MNSLRILSSKIIFILFLVVINILPDIGVGSTMADVGMWALSGVTGVTAVNVQRGITDYLSSVDINYDALSIGNKVYTMGAYIGPKEFAGVSIFMKPEPSVKINGRTVNFKPAGQYNGAIDSLYYHRTPASLTPDTLMAEKGWPNITGYHSAVWSLLTTVPADMPVGSYNTEITAQFCVGIDSYASASFPTGYYAQCYNNAPFSVRIPITINVTNQCTVSAQSLFLAHGDIIKERSGITTNKTSSSININCMSPTSMKLSFAGVSNINGRDNSVSMGDKWSSQLSTTIDSVTTVGSRDFMVSSKAVTINSTLTGEADALPGKKKSEAAVLVLVYN